jgi:hypothetical protein
VWQGYPLKGIPPWDSQEQKRKDGKEWLRPNRIDERCTRHHGWGILSFLHSHLIHPSSSIVLLSLGRDSASIAIGWWCWSSCRCQSRTCTWVGVRVSEVTLLSIIVTLLIHSNNWRLSLMIHTFQNLEDFEFNSRFRNSSTLRVY